MIMGKLDKRYVVVASATQDGILKKEDYNKIFSSGSNGQVLTWNNGAPEWGSVGSAFSASSLSNPGYATFSNGLMMQWGYANHSYDTLNPTDHTVTFATPFPTECFTVIATLGGYADGVNMAVWSYNTTSFVVRTYEWQDGIQNIDVTYVAFGN